MQVSFEGTRYFTTSNFYLVYFKTLKPQRVHTIQREEYNGTGHTVVRQIPFYATSLFSIETYCRGSNGAY